jgi:predicted HicB family RNase H-like nuclease
MNSIEKRITNIPEVEPDELDQKMIRNIEKRNDTSEGITLDEMQNLVNEKENLGRISLRVPKILHKQLKHDAEENGVSLNQFIVYKLAK